MPSTPKETTTKVEPWDGAKPYLTDVYKQYNDLIKAGAPKQWSGSTVADQSAATKAGQTGTYNYATNAANQNALNQATTTANNIAKGQFDQTGNNTLKSLTGGVNLGTNGAASGVSNFLNTTTNPATQQAANSNNFNNAAMGLQTQQANKLATEQNPANANLAAMASGANIGKNPYLDQSVSNATQKIADQLANVTNPQIMGGAAGAGRLGSNAFASQLNNAQSAAADAMTKTATDMYANQFNTDTNYMLNANSQVAQNYNNNVNNAIAANANLAGTSNNQQSQRLNGTQLYGDLYKSQQQNTLSGLGLMNDIYNQGAQNQFTNAGLKADAANSLNGNQNSQYGLQLSGAGMAGQNYQNGLLPYQTLTQLGSGHDTRNQDILNNQIQRYEQAQQQPLTNLGNFTNILNGGGYSNTTTPVYSNTGSQVFGGLVSLLGLL
jgi:hypothetical protein